VHSAAYETRFHLISTLRRALNPDFERPRTQRRVTGNTHLISSETFDPIVPHFRLEVDYRPRTEAPYVESVHIRSRAHRLEIRAPPGF
jgi:hypothetical protein